MNFNDGSDLNDFLFYADLVKSNDTDNQLDVAYRDFEVLRSTYCRNDNLQSYYNDNDLGFRDFLKRNAITD